MKKFALIVVDLQVDFCPGGALPVPQGDEVVPIINELLPKFELVIFTKDWHSADSLLFASHWPDKKPFDTIMLGPGEDTLWQDHCVEGTPGADIHKDIDFKKCKKDFYIFKKGLAIDSQGYSAFEDTGLTEFLKERNIDTVVIVGLALDYCVKNTALDAVAAGFKTIVIEDACKPIDPNINPTLKKFKENGIFYIDSWELDHFTL